MLFLAEVGDLGVKYDSAFSDFMPHHPLAALNASSNKQEGGLKDKSLLGNSASIPPSTKARNFLEPNTALSVLQVNHLTKCCLAVPPAGLQADGTHWSVLCAAIRSIGPVGSSIAWGSLLITQRLTEVIHLLLIEASVIQFISKNEAKQERKKIMKNCWPDEYASANNSALF